MAKRYDHTHKYMRVDAGVKNEYIVYRCMETEKDCQHYLRPAMVLGKKTVCWKCRGDAVMDSENITRKKPICVSCRSSNPAELLDFIEEAIKTSGS